MELDIKRFEEIKKKLNITLDTELAKGDELSVKIDSDKAYIVYSKPVEAFRALSIIGANENKENFEIHQKAAFTNNGIMLDCSRNAVLKVETVTYILEKMALMGLDMAMLYTEDTYEIESRPYFGYLRGRYTEEEIRKLDDYAYSLGIELIPCIQTLAHLERAIAWRQAEIKNDTEDILLVGDESTYEFIEDMIKTTSQMYHTKRIHIGMDEAMDLGLGNYLFINGYKNKYDIITEHLKRVNEILLKYGLEPMMWSDMYFRIASKHNAYYDKESVIPVSVIQSAPENIDLVYWDYYHENNEDYADMIRKHKLFNTNTIFAGGLWTWSGPAINYNKMLKVTIPALEECIKANVKQVFATAWGDDGAECNLLSTLYGLQIFAEFDYTHAFDKLYVDKRFEECVGEKAQPFYDMSMFNELNGMETKRLSPINLSKTMLYQDALVQMFEKDMDGIKASEHYKKLAGLFEKYKFECGQFKNLYGFYRELALELSLKCLWHENAADIVRRKDRIEAQKMCVLANEIVMQTFVLKKKWEVLWNMTNKPYGFEVIDVRLGGIASRFMTASDKMKAFADGKIDDIVELTSEKLYANKEKDGSFLGRYGWSRIISACNV